MGGNIACGLDPGREKFGLALTDGGTLIFSAIIPAEGIDDAIALLASRRWGELSPWGREAAVSPGELDRIGSCAKDYTVYIGDGTGTDIFQKKASEAGLRFVVTDETGTTLGGRMLYWRLHPPRGLWRLVPLSLRVPPRPIDDLAAWAIVQKARVSFGGG